jgi:hypothetical protein
MLIIELDKNVAYQKGNPIRLPSEKPKEIPMNPSFDPDWERNIKDMWWYHKNNAEPVLAKGILFDKRLFELREKLLSFGGSEVCLPVTEDDLEEILNRGQLWYGDRIHMMKGRPNQCHRNSAYCWNANKEKAVLCTGYALSEDRMWRQHSWLVELRPRKNKIVETTVERVAYFGFAMTEEEANQFYFDNE